TARHARWRARARRARPRLRGRSDRSAGQAPRPESRVRRRPGRAARECAATAPSNQERERGRSTSWVLLSRSPPWSTSAPNFLPIDFYGELVVLDGFEGTLKMGVRAGRSRRPPAQCGRDSRSCARRALAALSPARAFIAFSNAGIASAP